MSDQLKRDLEKFQRSEEAHFRNVRRAIEISRETAVVENASRLSQLQMSFAMHYHQFICFIIRGATQLCQRCEIDCHFLADKRGNCLFFCPHLTCDEWWILPKLALCFGKCMMRNFMYSREGRRIQFVTYETPIRHVCPLVWVPRVALSTKLYLFGANRIARKSAALRYLMRVLDDAEPDARFVSVGCDALFCGISSVFGNAQADGWREWK
jgi:hypothetical protein